jgi:hypothetical protein
MSSCKSELDRGLLKASTSLAAPGEGASEDKKSIVCRRFVWPVLPTNEQSRQEQLLGAQLPYVGLPTPSVGPCERLFLYGVVETKRKEKGRRETGPTYHDTSSSILYVTRKNCLNTLDMQRQPPFCRWLSRNMHVVSCALVSRPCSYTVVHHLYSVHLVNRIW